MAAPAGYTELGRIGFVDRGTYASGTTYRIGDVVYYNGSTWSALKDNLKGVTPVAGANWKYMARGFAAEALSAVTAKDTSGVLGTAGASVTSQALVDAIADKVMTKLIEKSKIVNNLLATDATTVLSGPMGKSLDEKIGKVNSDLANLKNAVGADYWSSVESINISANNWAAGTKKITLPPGRYIVIAHADFPPGENVGTLSVVGSNIAERQQSFYGSMLIRRVTTTFFEIVTSQKELKVALWSNTAMTAQDCEVMAIRIK